MPLVSCGVTCVKIERVASHVLDAVVETRLCYVRQGRYVMPGVCLSVCPYVKTTERIFTKILPQMCQCTRKNWLNFGSHPDPGIFWRIVRWGIFPQFGLYLWREWSDFHENPSAAFPWVRRSCSALDNTCDRLPTLPQTWLPQTWFRPVISGQLVTNELNTRDGPWADFEKGA